MTELSRNTSLNDIHSSLATLNALSSRMEGLFTALGHISNEIASSDPLWNAALALQGELEDRHTSLIKALEAVELNVRKLNRGGQA